MRKGFWVITFFLFAAMGRMQVSAQVPMPLDATGRNSPTLPGFPAPDQNLEGEEQEGTTKKKEKEKKPRKPLESYFFNDSVRARENFVWHIDLYRNNMSIRSVDTLLNIFQVDYPYMRQDVGSAYLGNLGGAAVPLNYFTRPEYRDFEFAEAYDVYFTTPERAPFFNVKHPFTQLSYYSAGQKKYAEESLYISHAQNVSPSSGFNLEYKSRGTMGIYEWQKARQKNLSLAFSHTGKKYTFHGGYIYNGAQMRENGGVTDDWFVTDTVMELATGIPMSLLDAQNQIKQNTYYMVHSYGIPLRKLSEEDFSIADRSTLYVGLSSMYTRIKKLYTDTYAKCDTSFYDNWFINSKASHDSIFETLLSNRAFIQIQPWSRDAVIGVIDGGVGMDLHHYYQFQMGDYLVPSRNGENRTSYYVYGSVAGKALKYADWGADLRFHPAGYRSGDLEFGANIALHAYSKKRPMTLSGSFRSWVRSPGYWTENYFSNHYVWSNSFAKENENRFDVRFTIPHLALELGGFLSFATDKFYYDATGVPAQGSVDLTAVYASKNFRLGGLNLDNRVLLQWSTDHMVAPVPLASAFLTYYYEFNLVRNVLRLQLGLDGRYNTEYYAFGYMPATAQFYNQREKELGNYIMVDAFVAAKWKRMRILLKMQHVNEDLWGARNYFTVLHYPQNKRVLKLGLSWGFYD